MLDLARDIIGSQPILTAFLAIGVGYLVGQINIFGFSLGVGAVLFVGLRHRRICTESSDHRADWANGPDHVPLRNRHSLRASILRGNGRRRAEVQPSRACRLSGGPGCRTAPGADLRHQDRAYAGPVRRIDDEYRNPPGRPRGDEEQGSLDRLLYSLPFRRHRTHSVHLFHDTDRKAEIPRKDPALPHGRDFGWRTLRRSTPGRSDRRKRRPACR